MDPKRQCRQYLPEVFVNPLLSRMLEFLPYRQVYANIRRVCSLWSYVTFHFERVRIDWCASEDCQETIVKSVNCSFVKVLEVYADVERTNKLLKLFKNAVVVCVAELWDADISACTSLKHLIVLFPSIPSALPPSLQSLTLQNALDCSFLATLPNLTRLGGITTMTSSDFKILNKLQITQACFVASNKTFNKTFVGYQLPEKTQDAIELQMMSIHCPRELTNAAAVYSLLTRVDVALQALQLCHFTLIADLPNVKSLTVRKGGKHLCPGLVPGRWLKLEEVTLEADVDYRVCKSFVSAKKLCTITFKNCFDKQINTGWLVMKGVPPLPQIKSVYCHMCHASFIKELGFFANADFLSADMSGICRVDNLCVLQIPPNFKKLVVISEYWFTRASVQSLVDRHDLREVSLIMGEALVNSEGTWPLTIPPETTLTMPAYLEKFFSCTGRVHFVDGRTLHARATRNQTYGAFLDCVESKLYLEQSS